MAEVVRVKAVKPVEAESNPEPEKAQKKKAPTSVLSDILLLLLKILIVILLFVLLFTFLFGATRYNDVAMEPNVKSGDLVLYSRVSKDFEVGQNAVLKYQGKTQVMRVVAVAGDTVDMTADGFVINGEVQDEPNPQKETLPYTEGISFPVTLKQGEIFLLGDDRENSADSRVYGAVNEEDTLGKVLLDIRRRNF